MSKQTFTTGQVLTAAQVNSLQANDYNQTVSVKTANYTLAAADKGTRIEFNTSASVTCTVNSGLFDAGDTLVIQNRGAGVVTVTPGTATVNTSATLALSQYDAGTLYFISNSDSIFFNTDAGGGGSPLTTKGDLYTFSTSDTRLGVGANGTVLTAASGEATGLQWAAPAAAAYVGVQANRNSSSQSISNVTYTAVAFPSEGWDTDGFHDTSSNNSRITIPAGKGGKYQFTFIGFFNSDVVTGVWTSIYKNGSALTGEGLDADGTLYNERGAASSFLGAITVSAVATDYFEIFVYQSSGQSKTLVNARLTADYLGA